MKRWLAALLVALVGCDRPAPAVDDGHVRIASFSPAMTRMVVDLGLGERLVGRTGYCRGVDDVPVVGDLHTVDAEALIRVAPTVVLVQRPAGDTDPTLTHVSSTRAWTVVHQPLVDLNDVRRFLETLPNAVPDEPGLAQRCQQRIQTLDAALEARPSAERHVLIVTPGAEPLAWGDATYLGQLVRAAGGSSVFEGPIWRTLSLEDLVRINPDLVLCTQAWPDPPEGLNVAVLDVEGLAYPGPHLAPVVDQVAGLLQKP